MCTATRAQKLVDSPNEPKWQRLRVANERLQQGLLSLQGGADALRSIGFVLNVEGDAFCWASNLCDHLPAAIQAIDAASNSAADDDAEPMTPAQLRVHWTAPALARKKVVGFYSDKPRFAICDRNRDSDTFSS